MVILLATFNGNNQIDVDVDSPICYAPTCSEIHILCTAQLTVHSKVNNFLLAMVLSYSFLTGSSAFRASVCATEHAKRGQVSSQMIQLARAKISHSF